MSGPDPATAATRVAVRALLAECAPGDVVLVACSGGADSLALAAAAAFESPRLGLRAGATVVDHQLQPDSAAVAARAAQACRELGLDPVEVAAVDVPASAAGVEAAARTARYAALSQAADRHRARLVLLGHTLDDQAEQVLLGLTRGAGARSLAGMPRARDRFRRPLLGVSRAQTRASCAALGLAWWDDPMNEDRAYTRVRARTALADLEADLGPGVAAALARTADQLREDADLLDALAAHAVAALGAGPWPVDELTGLPRPVRTRVWRRLAVAAGAPAGQVSARHTEACDALLTRWHGQGPVSLPGPLLASRAGGRVSIDAPDRVEWGRTPHTDAPPTDAPSQE
ncbi:tRNA lysidine(34) synthetase TilS [Nostocoides sp. HKS02]|uniref:tRNA lysidine(34) synthetase TilS n=1 Tax=Nostocoides sp. HKS02 TaxID=1813880 RepID=UPI0012B486D8|nr:tRNA lysidine(34) synthetase TilS [Tetrasphaera sp. HKS02]QGN58382.1 tRNA lysidine(34) synthetase TilS [Tetrasphaera sp. HKS02]